MTEFCYKGSNISAMKALGERTHFDISGHFVITEFDIEGVYCSSFPYKLPPINEEVGNGASSFQKSFFPYKSLSIFGEI